MAWTLRTSWYCRRPWTQNRKYIRFVEALKRKEERHVVTDQAIGCADTCHLTWSQEDGLALPRFDHALLPPPLRPRCRSYPAPIPPRTYPSP